MKHFLHNSLRALFLSLAVLLSLPVLAEKVEIDGINYELYSWTKDATVIKKSWGYYSGEVVIPESVEHEGTTYSVTSIGDNAFSGCSGLTSVTIPNSVKSIGGEAFHGCSGLTSVTIPKSVKSIGEKAFYECSGLTSVTIPNSVTSIGNAAFADCSGLTSVTIPNSVTSIGEYAFYECSGLTSVTIPNSVTSIGWYAFYSCSGLASVTIPNSVTFIGGYAFLGCSGLTSVHISDIAAWCNIEFYDMRSFGGSNPLSYAHHLYLNGEEVKDLVIPNSVTSIGEWAFYFCKGLTSVTIPNSVTDIGVCAFSGCSGLIEMKVDANNSKYDSREGCNAIIETSSNTLISGCQTSVIPNSVTSIGNGAFDSCSGLTSVTIPNSVTSIGHWAFYDCDGLTSVHISDLAAWCNIDFADYYSNPNPLSYAHHLYLNGEEVKDLVIPNSVTSIKTYAFSGCSGLTSVTIPNSVTSIGERAFLACSGLTSVTIPNSVTSIGESAFERCSGLTSVTIPNSVTSIGRMAFEGCHFVTENFVNNSSLSAEENKYWLAGLHDYETEDGLLIDSTNVAFCRKSANIVTIPNSVTSIGEWAFSGCSGLTSVTIPNSVTSIGRSAFSGCSGLTSVTIPNSVTSIGDYAFRDCSGLTSVTIPNSVTSIGECVFWNCSGLTSVTIGNSVESIDRWAFRDCPELLDVYCYAENVPSTHSSAFDGSYPEYATLHVPDASIDSYKAKFPWSKFGKIITLDAAMLVESITLSQSSATMTEGETLNLTATITPYDATDKSITWSSSNTSVASVDANGKVTAKAEGTATITATANDGSGVKASCVVSVEKKIVSVASITLSQSSATITEGETITLTATVTPDDATDKSITWSSSNTNVASVDADGKVTAKAEGTTTITATANDGSGVKASCEVTVEKKVILVNQITLSQTTATLIEGETLTLTATVTPDYADNTSVTWSSSNDEVAMVSSKGKVVALMPGTATITATANDGSGVSASCVVTVNEIIFGKCATPIISYADGQVSVTCETEDAKVVTTVANVDDGTYEEIEFSLTPTYTITAYATKAQYENSDVATLTLCWIACTEEHEDEEETGLINIPAKAVLIQSHQGTITLSGLDAGTEVSAYSPSGAQLATAVATDGTATLYTNLSTGSIIIVKFGNKSVKIKI